jgi:cysteine desulfurase/selenocysteine lyase
MLERSIRDDFALLRRTFDGKPLVYLDSAASSLSPAPVLAAEHACRERNAANVQRGRHALSEEASIAYAAARERVARFLCAEPRSVVFVRSATEGLNLVARGLKLQKDDVVLTTSSEHHSNLVPWMREARVELIRHDPCRCIEPDMLRDALQRHRPRVLALQHASNVTGVIQPVSELCRIAREFDAVSVIDASQSAPHLALDVDALGCDFLAFSAHKMLGPKGVGVLWGRYARLARLEPLLLGGGAVLSVSERGYVLRPPPEGLEAGTPNVAGAVGLAAALDYLEQLGSSAILEHGFELARSLEDALAALPVQRVLGSRERARLPIMSFTLRPSGITADQLAGMLSDSCGVMVRSGLLCTHPLFTELGEGQGAVRLSAYIYNQPAEIDHFARSCGRLLQRWTR